MEKKITLSTQEYKELQKFCNLNSLNEDDLIQSSFNKGLKIEMYGLLNSNQPLEPTQEKIIEKEVVKYVEVIKEVEVPKIEYVEIPVEVIKEIEIEKPVEVIIEKIIQDDSKTQELIEEFSNKIEEMEKKFNEEKKTLMERIDELGEGKVVELVKEIEIPVEVEKIVEIPVEIIKEVFIEKQSDSNKLKALEQTLQKLKFDNIEKDKKIKQLENLISDYQKNNPVQATFLRGSNLRDKLF